MKILMTGMTGFVGFSVFNKLDELKLDLVAVVRSKERLGGSNKNFIIKEIDSKTDWSECLGGLDVIIHCAARVHVMNDLSENPLAEFREVNTFGTLNLARQAAEAGVKRFIFVSSIKVNGEGTELNQSFGPDDSFITTDPYGQSKQEAEQGLLEISQETGMEVVIIRPPLVYGPGVKANFLSMMKLVYKGVPLPLGAIKNKRSFVALDNLVDLICVCIDHPNAKNQIFLAGDGCDVSTTELLQAMAKALGRSSRLVPIPMWLLISSARLIGRPDIAQRLCGSLQVDISKTQELLGWEPPITMAQGLRDVAESFIQKQDRL